MSSAENLISFFDIFSEVALVDSILNNFNSLKFSSLEYNEKPISLNSYNIYFHNVSINGKSNLKDINLKINHKDALCFIGDEDYKIEDIFNVLSRKAQVSSGCIFLDEKNITEIDLPTFNKSIATVTPDEQFFNISIYMI